MGIVIVARPIARLGGLRSTDAPVLTEHRVANDDERIRHIWGRVHKALRDPAYRERALRVTRRCPPRDDSCELAAIYEDTKKSIRYMADVRGIDTYQSPMRSREWGGGDCDDHLSDLIATATAAGFRAGARIISPDGREYTHTYAIVGVPKEEPTRVVTLDTTVPSAYPGWEPPKRLRRAQRDFWYSESESGQPVVELGDSEGTTVSPTVVVVVVAVVLAAVATTVVVWKLRRPS